LLTTRNTRNTRGKFLEITEQGNLSISLFFFVKKTKRKTKLCALEKGKDGSTAGGRGCVSLEARPG
jgi:hypothetical protein